MEQGLVLALAWRTRLNLEAMLMLIFEAAWEWTCTQISLLLTICLRDAKRSGEY
jgi:hypothetical protein